jgi:hypothetical protein
LATRVAGGLSTALFDTAVPGDPGRLFVVHQTGAIKIVDLNRGQVLARRVAQSNDRPGQRVAPRPPVGAMVAQR